MQFRFAALLYCAAVLTPLVATAQQRMAGLSPTDSSATVPIAPQMMHGGSHEGMKK